MDYAYWVETAIEGALIGYSQLSSKVHNPDIVSNLSSTVGIIYAMSGALGLNSAKLIFNVIPKSTCSAGSVNASSFLSGVRIEPVGGGNNGQEIIKLVGSDGIWFLNTCTGGLYDVLGNFVYQYPGNWSCPGIVGSTQPNNTN